MRRPLFAGGVAVASLTLSLLVAPLVQAPARAADQVWPGGQSARAVDVPDQIGGDLSGLSYRAGATRAADVLWGVDDRDGLIHRLVLTSGTWRPTTSNGWGAGKRFTFPDGRRPDAEGIVVLGDQAWVSTERDSSGASRPSILRVPLGGSGSRLGATQEWRLKGDFPSLNPNLGFESIGHVPDSHLVSRGFVDQSRNAVYDPARYPKKVGGGVFFVAAEAPSLKGQLRGYVLNSDGSFVRVATVTNPLGIVMDLEFEPATGRLWVSCDDYCSGRHATLEIRSGRFTSTGTYARPTGLPNHNNEGFAIAPESRCSAGRKPVFWSNDSNNGSHAVRAGTLRCGQTSGAARRSAGVSISAPDGQAGQARRVRVRVSAGGATPGGEVIVTVAGRTRVAALEQGRAVVRLGRFVRPGLRRVRATYAGDGTTAEATVSTTLRTRKAVTRLTPRKRMLTTRRGSRARIVATLSANGLRARAGVRVKVGKRFVQAQVRRSGNRVVVRTPRLTARRQTTVTLLYRGGPATTRARAVVRVRLR